MLTRDFYNRSTVQVAQELLGKRIVRIVDGKRLSGIIVETEAYQADDPACHAHRGMTERNKALFGPVGHSYVYFIYGNHYCLNFVARHTDMISGGVLIRAIVPEEGIEFMRKMRKVTSDKNLANGPGKLAQALHITRADQNIDLTKKGPLYVEEAIVIAPQDTIATPRIGISKAVDHLWRFIVNPQHKIFKI